MDKTLVRHLIDWKWSRGSRKYLYMTCEWLVKAGDVHVLLVNENAGKMA
ncbi:MAG: hypothetical protein QW172_01935 [Candidatus Bathyarchaeia archaeon]